MTWTPQAIITATVAVIGLLLTIAGIVYGAGRLLAGFASREELDRLRRDMDAAIKDQSKISQDSHKEFARQSAVVRIEGNLLDLEKEVRLEIKELRESMDAKFEKTHNAHVVILDLLTKINHQTTKRTA
jgi:hypothetical protein